MLANNVCSPVPKRKRRPAGTPDAEVVSLSAKALLESDRYVCEICNTGFQRDQNLQMHRRRHKVPWKLLKRETPPVARKLRVFVCPELSCLHHNPFHALGDLVGIKKHFRRKHGDHKQWVCERCSKGYAVQSDYKAHPKICGTRGHSCDCDRVFSRVESFIEHQDACQMSRIQQESHAECPPCLSRTASSTNPSSDTNFSTVPRPSLELAKTTDTMLLLSPTKDNSPNNTQCHNLDLQLLSTSNPTEVSVCPKSHDNHSIQLHLSIGSSDTGTEKEPIYARPMQLRLAMVEKPFPEEARRQAKRQMELAEHEFARANRIRQQAQAETAKAQALKDQAVKQIKSTILLITCHACKQRFQATTTPPEENSLVSYISSALTEGEVENEI
ncbi:Protein SHOOT GRAVITROPISM 5 [Hibiscus syriacus]|uniref:Protein SHOOT GRAVITROPISM 5 n=1 Tax=Hibiscus syriacus TaxID=106335 RepID=A0A6A3BL56_HIBSY|nr:Protein SHOOT GRAVITROPISM 5 [Hibiscus syriacus]